MSIAAASELDSTPSNPLTLALIEDVSTLFVEAHIAQFPAVRLLSTAYRESPDRNFLSRPGNWRAWSFRTWRLERYFANTPPER